MINDGEIHRINDRYSVQWYSSVGRIDGGDLFIYESESMQCFLMVHSDEDSGLALFEAASRDFRVMDGILKWLLEELREKDESCIIVPDGRWDMGVELVNEFGFATSGYDNSLSCIHPKAMDVRLACNEDGDATLLCTMAYFPDLVHQGRTVDVRLGSGKGFDEAFSNAVARIGRMRKDIVVIEEWLFGKLVSGG